MPSLSFPEPSQYIRYVGPVLAHSSLRSPEGGSEERLRFIRLNAREGPLKYPYRFNSVAPGAVSSAQSFGDLELAPKHIAKFYFGISYGARARLFLPFDERILRLDQPTLDLIQEKDTANIDWEDSPIEEPKFNFWLAPTENFVPAVDVENVLSHIRPARNLNVDIAFYGMKYTYEFVTKEADPENFEKLRRFQIPSDFATFGGKI